MRTSGYILRRSPVFNRGSVPGRNKLVFLEQAFASLRFFWVPAAILREIDRAPSPQSLRCSAGLDDTVHIRNKAIRGAEQGLDSTLHDKPALTAPNRARRSEIQVDRLHGLHLDPGLIASNRSLHADQHTTGTPATQHNPRSSQITTEAARRPEPFTSPDPAKQSLDPDTGPCPRFNFTPPRHLPTPASPRPDASRFPLHQDRPRSPIQAGDLPLFRVSTLSQ